MQTKTNIFLKAAVFLLMLSVVPKGFAQDEGGFIVVRDSKDTFVNLRSTDNTNPATVIARLQNGAIGYCFEKYSNWMMFEYMQGDSLVSGFVHSSLAKPVSDFQKLESSGNSDSVAFIGENIRVTLSRKAFSKSKHSFTYDKNHFLKSIDFKKAWGTDGNLPINRYDKILVTFGSQTMELPFEAISGLYEPNLSPNFTQVYYDKANDTLYITALNSDGAGSYALALIIENKKYRERIISIPF